MKAQLNIACKETAQMPRSRRGLLWLLSFFPFSSTVSIRPAANLAASRKMNIAVRSVTPGFMLWTRWGRS